MTKLRVHCFSISLDGYGAGPNQSVDNPLGVGGVALHEWAFATRTFQKLFGNEGGATGLDAAALGYQCSEHVSSANATHVILTRKI